MKAITAVMMKRVIQTGEMRQDTGGGRGLIWTGRTSKARDYRLSISAGPVGAFMQAGIPTPIVGYEVSNVETVMCVFC